MTRPTKTSATEPPHLVHVPCVAYKQGEVPAYIAIGAQIWFVRCPPSPRGRVLGAEGVCSVPQARREMLLPVLQQRGVSAVSLAAPNAARCGVVRSDALQALLSPETVLEPLNAATEPWVRAIVWTDFRTAVTLFVAVPFALLGWSAYACRPPGQARSPTAEAALRCMSSYWQASSLLLITVAFNVQGMQLGVLTGLVAQAMILVSLWWWADLNDELRLAPPSALRSSFLTWRALASVAAAGGVLVQAPFQSCVAVPQLAADARCAAWLEPPQVS